MKQRDFIESVIFNLKKNCFVTFKDSLTKDGTDVCVQL